MPPRSIHFRCSKKPLPRRWGGVRGGPQPVAEFDVRVCNRGRLAAKVMVFRTQADLKTWWRVVLGVPLGGRAMAAVNMLQYWVEKSPGRRRGMVVDSRYFCLMGFVQRWLSMEIITHESVHAGYAYAKRARRTPWAEYTELDEERVAYPAGKIAAAINRLFHKRGLYPCR